MARHEDFRILTSKTPSEMETLVKAQLAEGWEILEGGFHLEYLDQTATNYVCALVKPATVAPTNVIIKNTDRAPVLVRTLAQPAVEETPVVKNRNVKKAKTKTTRKTKANK
jgi:hypothetical protein